MSIVRAVPRAAPLLDRRRADREQIDAVRWALADPVEVARRLGLLAGARRQHHGVIVRCPAHDDRRASCSLRLGVDGTLAVHCHANGCELSGDVFHLIAAVDHLDNRDFVAVLRRAAEIARMDIDARPSAPRRARLSPGSPPRGFPPIDDVRALWTACGPCRADAEVTAWLRSRALDPAIVDQLGLARALPRGAPAPWWTRYQGDAHEPRPWTSLGYRCIVPMFSADGELRSVRARHLGEPDGQPKALPATGYTTKGLVMLNPLGVMMMQIAAWRAGGTAAAREHGGDGWPAWAQRRVLITEGEPDFLTWAARSTEPATLAVMGIGGSGQWTDTIADRIPDGTVVIVRTDEDDAGDAYAAEIAESLRGRCDVRETNPAVRAERRLARAGRAATRCGGRSEHAQMVRGC
jgi:hypothetical protein